MSRADDVAAKARRLRTRTPVDTASSTAVSTASSTPVPTASSNALRTAGSAPVGTAARVPVVRTRPVRMTLDLPPAEHAALRQLCIDLADDLGLVQIPAREVLRALLRRAVDDEATRDRLRDDLAADR